MTALEAACERDFAFAAYSANAPFFRTTIRMREDGKTLSTEQLQWLLKGSNLGIEACTLLWAREMRMGNFLPISAEEERTIRTRLHHLGAKGN